MGGQYRICWCSQDFQCSLAEDFSVDSGSLFMVGPAPLGQHRTCVAGFSCSVDGITGMALNAEDTYLLRDSCHASAAPPEGLPDAGLAMRTASGAVQWGAAEHHLTAKGGVYALCWCAAFPGASNSSNKSMCSQSSSFVQFGSLTLIGPSPREQSRTCYSGQQCMLSGFNGLHLADTSQVRILSSCGGEEIPGWPDDFQLLLPSENSSGSMAVRWGTVSVAGATYRLCWCFDDSCDSLGSWIDFGTLHLAGPQPLQQHRTCVTGQLCGLAGLTGYALPASSHVMVLETCGADTRGWRASDAVVLRNDSNISFSLTQPGGMYRMCWCSTVDNPWSSNASLTSSDCSLSSDFRVDMGELLVIGVAPLTQHRTCISGLTCSFDVDGLWLATGDVVSAFDTCGAEASKYSADLVDLWGNSTGNRSLDSRAVSGATLRPGTILALSGGLYRLCWCPGSVRDCLGGQDFNADFGALTVIGPSPLKQMRTCVAGQACALDGIEGQDLSPEASFAALDTCGTVTSAPFLPNVITHDGSTLPLSRFTLQDFSTTPVVAGQYSLCWCPRPAANASMADFNHSTPCLLEDHSVPAGTLHIIGPSPLQTTRTCISGQACAIHGLTGAGAYHLTPGDQLLLLDTCGASGALLQRSVRQPMSAQTALVFSSGVIFSWSEMQSTAGGNYRMCWCAAGFACSTADHFRVDVGELLILGPTPLLQDRTCVSGRRCNVEGLQLFPAPSQGNSSLNSSLLSVMVLDTCGTFSLPARLAPAGGSDGSDLLLSEHVSSAGGMHRLCWCGMPPCEKATHFKVDAGQLLLLGPTPLQQQMTCVSGQSCIVQLSSSTMTATEMSMHTNVYLHDACLATTPVSAAAPIAGPLQQSAPVVLTAAGGVYRMCWCSTLHGNTCAPSDYIVDAGQLLLIGPSPHAQTRTCIGGLACRFHDFDGLYLQPEDRLLLLDTCGQNSYIGVAAFLHPPGSQSNDTNATGPVISAVSAVSSLLHITGAGGVYRLCWCSAGFECNLPENFKVDLGQLHLLAPSLIGKTCLSGQVCQLEEVFEGFASDSILVLETCGLASPVEGFGDSVWSSANSDMFVSAAGGIYRICWCAGGSLSPNAPCHIPESFDTDLGFLMVIGPSPLQQYRTCVAGQVCRLSPLLGHFPAGDSVDSLGAVAILETCAIAISPGLRALSSGGFNGSQSPGSVVPWDMAENASEVPWRQEGALYRLCWCLDAQGCSRVEDYRTDVGGLLVVGPSPLLQLRTCISGHSCAFEGVTGLGLSSSYYISRIRLYQDGATSHDVRVWELYHSESPNGPWIKAFNGAAAPGVGEQEFGGWSPSASPYWRLVVLQTYSGQEPRLREVQFVAEGKIVRLGSSRVVSASGLVHSSGGVSYPASNLVDGKLEDDSRSLLQSWLSFGSEVQSPLCVLKRNPHLTTSRRRRRHQPRHGHPSNPLPLHCHHHNPPPIPWPTPLLPPPQQSASDHPPRTRAQSATFYYLPTSLLLVFLLLSHIRCVRAVDVVSSPLQAYHPAVILSTARLKFSCCSVTLTLRRPPRLLRARGHGKLRLCMSSLLPRSRNRKGGRGKKQERKSRS